MNQPLGTPDSNGAVVPAPDDNGHRALMENNCQGKQELGRRYFPQCQSVYMN